MGFNNTSPTYIGYLALCWHILGSPQLVIMLLPLNSGSEGGHPPLFQGNSSSSVGQLAGNCPEGQRGASSLFFYLMQIASFYPDGWRSSVECIFVPGLRFLIATRDVPSRQPAVFYAPQPDDKPLIFALLYILGIMGP